MKRFALFTITTIFLITTIATEGKLTVKDILQTSGFKGGFAVQLGCSDGNLATGLGAANNCTVHVLEPDTAKVAAARAHIRKTGTYGRVSVEAFTGARLPYADNLINLVIVEAQGAIPDSEIMRVLVPGGVVLEEGKKTVKPYPPNIDDWSHYLHDAGNNAVAKDNVVGPPRRLQWVSDPLWLRSHETPSGVQAQVAAGGRLFYIFDEGLIGITDERLPARWSIICRDAFNGRFLWKRELPDWGWRQWARDKLEGKDWTRIRALRTVVPEENQWRLVAEGEHLYATMGYDAPLSILSAASGETLRTVEGTKRTRQIRVSDGVVIAVTEAGPRNAPGEATLVAVDGASGKVLWRKEIGGRAGGLHVGIDHGKVFCLPGAVLALDLKSGNQVWKGPLKTKGVKTLVADSGVVLLLGGTSLESYDAANGKLLWKQKIPGRSGGESPDLFVVDGIAWPGMIPVDEGGKRVGKSEDAMVLGFDVRTGEQKKRIVVKKLRSPEHHHRCYRNKATTRYIISGMEGAEFLDLEGQAHEQDNWLRGACKLGIMPCYGLTFVPPDQCFCQPGGKLLGYKAVAAGAEGEKAGGGVEMRLVKGKAFSAMSDPKSHVSDDSAWPTYRGDSSRHGSSKTEVPAKPAVAWNVKLGGRLTQPVVADGRLIVAAVDTHTVHALDSKTGKPIWDFAAGGRIDSPPTLYKGLVLFGSCDGWVYGLRQSDGALVWRFLAAPYDRRVAAFDQLESAWPVHGSVLIEKGVAYVAAGRSTYLDGGIRLYGLDPISGKVLHAGVLEGPRPDIKKGERDKAFYVPGANSDVLVSEGGHLYMRQKKLTLDLKEVDTAILSSKGETDVGLHVFSTAGLLDGSWYNRTFWMYAKRWPGFQLANQAPKSGQLLVVDDTTTYGLKAFYRRNVHSPMFFPGKEGYLLFADKNTTEPQIVGEEGARAPLRWLPQSDYARGRGSEVRKLESSAFGGDKGIGYTRADPPLWMTWVPVRIRAMVKTKDLLFAAGSPDVLKGDPFAGFEGRTDARLLTLSTKDGKKLGELTLAAPPVFDGMIAAEQKLFVSLVDGSVVCLGR